MILQQRYRRASAALAVAVLVLPLHTPSAPVPASAAGDPPSPLAETHGSPAGATRARARSPTAPPDAGVSQDAHATSSTRRGIARSSPPATPAPPARAQAPATIDSIARAFYAEHRPAGLVVAVTTRASDRVLSYGVASLEDAGPPVGDSTRFEVGSVTKVFTALLLAEMAARGEIELDDPISRYLPDDVAAPSYEGAPITLRHLAMHTSGLPRLPTNIAPANMADPYADYTAERLYAFLAEYALPRAPGARYEYSNLGAGLLGHLLARRAGMPFDTLLAQRVLRPLGLGDTYVAGPDDADERLATGHAQGKPVPFWHFGALAGAGALRSTAADLLRFLRIQFDPSSSPLRDAIRLSRQPRAPAGPNASVALGWHISTLPRGDTLYWHNGGTGGFRSFIGFMPDRGIGVVLLMNSAVPLQAFDGLALAVATNAGAQPRGGS